MEQIFKIAEFIFDSFVHIWPYLVITIPMAVAVQLTGISKIINKVMRRNPVASILLATIVGAISPFCSCGVIPIIASLLLGGVPLAPVMSFWIASPSMDPEIFFLSTATIGWELSIWRLAATFVISLASGFITHIAFQKGLLGNDFLRNDPGTRVKISLRSLMLKLFYRLKYLIIYYKPIKKIPIILMNTDGFIKMQNVECCVPIGVFNMQSDKKTFEPENNCNSCESEKKSSILFRNKLLIETRKATVMVIKFMALAFFINALINFYVPQEFISKLLGGDSSFSVITASLVGIPVYTSNLTALPLVGGLLSLGMNEGAALAFLIAGPTTTLPAMIAVWGITKKKIFFLYISFSLFGAILFGLLYNIIN